MRLPCPYCGSTDLTDLGYQLGCNGCGATGPGNPMEWPNTPQEQDAAWNQRDTLTAICETIRHVAEHRWNLIVLNVLVMEARNCGASDELIEELLNTTTFGTRREPVA